MQMQFIATKDGSQQFVTLAQLPTFKQLGWDIAVMLPYNLSDTELAAIEDGASVSISEVTFTNTLGISTASNSTPYKIINNAVAAKAFPMLIDDTMKLAAASVAMEQEIVDTDGSVPSTTRALELASEQVAAMQSVSTMSVDGTEETEQVISLNAMGTTEVVSVDPPIIKRIIPWKELMNAIGQHSDA